MEIALETYVKVLGVNVAVLGLVEVLLGDEHTLAEEVLVDRLAVGLGNQPGAFVSDGSVLAVICGRSSHFGSVDCWLVWLVGGLDKVVVVNRRQRKYNFQVRRSALGKSLCADVRASPVARDMLPRVMVRE